MNDIHLGEKSTKRSDDLVPAMGGAGAGVCSSVQLCGLKAGQSAS